VPDADQRRMIRFPDQQLHELFLASRIQCGGRFIEDNDVRVLKNNARERKTLLFTPTMSGPKAPPPRSGSWMRLR
jgi:hypothetical protein